MNNSIVKLTPREQRVQRIFDLMVRAGKRGDWWLWEALICIYRNGKK